MQKLLIAAIAVAVAGPATAQQAPNPLDMAGAGVRGGMSQILGRAFEKIDVNRDGQATREEAMAHAKRVGIPIQQMDGAAWGKADVNRDGRVSREEFMRAMMAHFDMPTNMAGQR